MTATKLSGADKLYGIGKFSIQKHDMLSTLRTEHRQSALKYEPREQNSNSPRLNDIQSN